MQKEQEQADIVFVTTNANASSFDDMGFNVTIGNGNDNDNNASKNSVCKPNCQIEVIKFITPDSGLSTGIVVTPNPNTQNMYANVDIRIRDSANDGMSETKREYQERWSIFANCNIKEIQDTVFLCGNDTLDTITLTNKLLDKELVLPLISGKYDTKTDTMTFTANFEK